MGKHNVEFKFELGREARDKVTGFTGTLTGRVDYLYGCHQYGITPKVDKDGKTGEIGYFDEGRIEIIGSGIHKEEVMADNGVKGGPSTDAPRK